MDILFSLYLLNPTKFYTLGLLSFSNFKWEILVSEIKQIFQYGFAF